MIKPISSRLRGIRQALDALVKKIAALESEAALMEKVESLASFIKPPSPGDDTEEEVAEEATEEEDEKQ